MEDLREEEFEIITVTDDETGEEYPLYTCQKGNDVSLDFKCEDFKEYKPKPYKEEDTECDKCYKKNECIEKGLTESPVIPLSASIRHAEFCRKLYDEWEK